MTKNTASVLDLHYETFYRSKNTIVTYTSNADSYGLIYSVFLETFVSYSQSE
jgi:hypothetical protein